MGGLEIELHLPLILDRGLKLDQAVEQVSQRLELIKKLSEEIPQKEYFTIGTRYNETRLIFSKGISTEKEAIQDVREVCSFLFEALKETPYRMWIFSVPHYSSLEDWLNLQGKTDLDRGYVQNKKKV